MINKNNIYKMTTWYFSNQSNLSCDQNGRLDTIDKLS